MTHKEDNIIRLPAADEDIIRNIKAGAVEDFRLIIKKYNQRLYRITLSFGISDFDAEDIIQRAYISAYRKIDQFKGESKFSTWLIRITINECLMHKRSMKNKRDKGESLLSDFTSKQVLLNEDNPEEVYMKSELKQIMEDAIKCLPEKYRSVYVIREVEGLSTKEASDILNISEENVKIRLFRSKELIKEHLLNNFNKKELLSFGNERCDRVTENVMNFLVSDTINS